PDDAHRRHRADLAKSRGMPIEQELPADAEQRLRHPHSPPLARREHDGEEPRDHTGTVFAIGSSRIRLPVSAKIAFASAGATGGTPGSPIRPGGPSLSIVSTWIVRGAEPMRSRR